MAERLQNLDWSLVQTFLAVAETGSLSAAGRQLGQSQPTVGRQIQAMEMALGLDLFSRKNKGMALTEAGAALIEPAKAMQVAANALAFMAAGEAEDISGTVRITASIFFAHHILPPVLARLRQTHPEIAIELVASDASDNLLFREADIAIRMYRPTQLDMVTRHLGDISLGLFAAQSFLARKGRPTSFADLESFDFVGYDANDQIIQGMRAFGMNVDRDWFVVRCDHQTTYWELVRAGCGIGISQLAVGRADEQVEEIDLEIPIPQLPVWLTSHEKLRHTPRIRRVWDHLTEQLPPLLS